MQSTGHTSTQDLSLMSMHGSAMMYVIGGESNDSARRAGRLLHELVDQLGSALGERGACDDAVESGGLRSSQPVRVRVVREPENRRLRISVSDLVRIDAR